MIYIAYTKLIQDGSTPCLRIREDFRPLNLGLHSTWKKTQDRGNWREIVDAATLRTVCHDDGRTS